MGAYGGLAAPAPRYAALFAVAAFASLGLPGFSRFIAKSQVFAGSLGPVPLVAVALPGSWSPPRCSCAPSSGC
jgi:NADH-quinone oxidoreductase subunit M